MNVGGTVQKIFLSQHVMKISFELNRLKKGPLRLARSRFVLAGNFMWCIFSGCCDIEKYSQQDKGIYLTHTSILCKPQKFELYGIKH